MILLLIGIGMTEALITSGGGRTIITYNITNAQAIEVGNAFAWAYDYKNETCSFNQVTGLLQCVPNPQTKTEFVDNKIKQYIKDVVIAYRQSQLNTTIDTNISVN